MGHLFFLILHLVAIVFGFWMLLFSIPFHIFYAYSRSNKKNSQEQTELLREQVELLKKNQGEGSSE